MIIDTAAGVLGRYDPRPVQSDSLFPVFSVSKGITAGMLHWLVDKGYVKLLLFHCLYAWSAHEFQVAGGVKVLYFSTL